MGFFKIDQGLLVLDKEEIRGIPEFQKILVRDKGSDGDATGRNKAMAFKEFYYIWYKCDLESPGNNQGYDAKTLDETAKREARLPENWKADKVINDACEKYKEDTPVELILLNSSLRAMTFASKTMGRLSANIEKLYDSYEKLIKAKEDRNEIVDMSEDLTNLQTINNHLSEIMKLAGKVPDMIETLNKNRTMALKAKQSKRLIRGDHAKGNRADPPPPK